MLRLRKARARIEVSRGGYDDWSPFLSRALGSKPDCTSSNPATLYATFNAEPHIGWTLYEWEGDPGPITFAHRVVPYACKPVSVSAKFVELDQLTWTVDLEASYGGTPDDACVGYCRVNPASAYYQASTIVQIKAIAQPGFVFKHWGGKGKAWTHAEEVSGGGWVVDGAGQDLEGITADTIYINMGDGGAKPKPKDRDLFAVFCPCIHGGGGENGWLKGDTSFGALTPGLGRYGRRDSGGDDSGCLLYIHEKLKGAGTTWHSGFEDENNPAGLVRFNDISKPDGGEFGHSSHENGLDVDIQYVHQYEQDENENYIDQGAIDFDLSNDMIAQFAAGSDVTKIYIGTWSSLDASHDKVSRLTEDHQDHFHVRYRDPDGDQ